MTESTPTHTLTFDAERIYFIKAYSASLYALTPRTLDSLDMPEPMLQMFKN